LFDFGNAGNANNILVVRSGSNILFRVRRGLGSDFKHSWVDGWQVGVWTHVVWVLSVPGSWKMFVNGARVASLTDMYYPDNITCTLNYIGRSTYDNDVPYIGHMDSFAIFAYALTDSEAIALYQVTCTYSLSACTPSWQHHSRFTAHVFVPPRPCTPSWQHTIHHSSQKS
jgi:hypothetical protein